MKQLRRAEAKILTKQIKNHALKKKYYSLSPTVSLSEGEKMKIHIFVAVCLFVAIDAIPLNRKNKKIKDELNELMEACAEYTKLGIDDGTFKDLCKELKEELGSFGDAFGGVTVSYDKKGFTDDYDKKGVTDDYDKKGFTDDYDKKGFTDDYDKKGFTDDYDKKGVTDDYDKKGFTDDYDKKGFTDDYDKKGVTDDYYKKGVTDDYDRKGVTDYDKKFVTDVKRRSMDTEKAVDRILRQLLKL